MNQNHDKKERSVVNKMSAYIKKKENVHRRVLIKNAWREILVCVSNECTAMFDPTLPARIRHRIELLNSSNMISRVARPTE